ncbi:MAG: OB-fold nucleic acid binding domain-containing protein, partial [Gammaproteobacteria bacterium]
MKNVELTGLKGVGPAVKAKLEKLNIKTQSDLLFLLPTRYENRTFIKNIGLLVPDEEAQIEGRVVVCNIVYRGRRMMVMQLADETGFLTVRFFTFNKYQAAGLKPNTIVRCFGKTRKISSGVEMIHPSYQIINNNDLKPLPKTLTPVYPTTKGLPQAKLRQIVSLGIQEQLKQTDELLPEV